VWLGAAVAVLAALPLAWSQPPVGKKYAVLVGVNAYQHPKLPALRYAEADVTALKKVLDDAGYQVTLLTGAATDPNLRPTKQNIEQQLRRVGDKCLKGDTLLLAFAGHGLQFEKIKKDDPDDAYFCPADARPFRERRDTLVSLRHVYDGLDQSNAGMKVLLVDACRNDPDTPRGVRSGVTADSVRPPAGVAALFSCGAGERAFETDELQHGVFFYHLIKGLEGEAQNKRGEVTFTSLTEHVQYEVVRGTKSVTSLVGGTAKQSPNFKADLSTESVLLTVKGSGRLAARPKSESPKAARPKALTAPFNATEAKAAQRAWAEYLGVPVGTALDLGGGENLDLVLIPPGSFIMGSPAGEKDREGEEAAHTVTLTKPFYLGKYAVTQAQYRAVMGKNPSWFSAGGGGKAKVKGLNTGRFPVESVSWEDAGAFCEAAGRKAGKKVGLPSEAEWEYACRAGTATPFHFGSKLNGRQANCHGNYPYGTKEKGPYLGRTCAVGSYAANSWGLFDMHGNVQQWCQDWYGLYKGLGTEDPIRLTPLTSGARLLRGGSWDYGAMACRAAFRGGIPPSHHYDGSTGFRVAVHLD
jgi:formylglycine-generating enzyme required for sulfatase activity